jgi:hypothetical protein
MRASVIVSCPHCVRAGPYLRRCFAAIGPLAFTMRADHAAHEIGRHGPRGAGFQPDSLEPSNLPHPASAFRWAASRFLAASASRAEPSRAKAFSARRCSLRLCFVDACFDVSPIFRSSLFLSVQWLHSSDLRYFADGCRRIVPISPSIGHLEKYPFRAACKSDSKNLFEFDPRERVRWGNWVSLI